MIDPYRFLCPDESCRSTRIESRSDGYYCKSCNHRWDELFDSKTSNMVTDRIRVMNTEE